MNSIGRDGYFSCAIATDAATATTQARNMLAAPQDHPTILICSSGYVSRSLPTLLQRARCSQFQQQLSLRTARFEPAVRVGHVGERQLALDRHYKLPRCVGSKEIRGALAQLGRR